MGDIIEFITSPSLGHRSFKLTSNGINFDVKTPEFATLILSGKPRRKFDNIWIKIENDISWIGKISRGQRVLIKTPEIVARNSYTRLWVAWDGNFVTLGKEGHIIPILKYACKTPQFKYVTFLKERGYHSVYWRVELPPSLKLHSINKVSVGNVCWVPTIAEQMPKNALIGGFKKENLYLIRAPHRGSLTPGKFVPSEGCGYIAWGGEAHAKTEFEVLCGYNCEWIQTVDDKIPVGAVEGGYSEVRREVLYVGRAFHCGFIIPGKIAPSHRVCYIPFNGKEIAVRKYEILIAPTRQRCANKFILPNETSHMQNTEDGDAFSDDDA